MKDGILLLITGVICAVLAWGFFHYFQNWALTIIIAILAIAIIARPKKAKFGKKDDKSK